MLFKDYVEELGGVDKICDIYLNGITRQKFNSQFQSNKDLIIYSFKKLNASADFLKMIKEADDYDSIMTILRKVKGGEIKWN